MPAMEFRLTLVSKQNMSYVAKNCFMKGLVTLVLLILDMQRYMFVCGIFIVASYFFLLVLSILAIILELWTFKVDEVR